MIISVSEKESSNLCYCYQETFTSVFTSDCTFSILSSVVAMIISVSEKESFNSCSSFAECSNDSTDPKSESVERLSMLFSLLMSSTLSFISSCTAAPILSSTGAVMSSSTEAVISLTVCTLSNFSTEPTTSSNGSFVGVSVPSCWIGLSSTAGISSTNAVSSTTGAVASAFDRATSSSSTRTIFSFSAEHASCSPIVVILSTAEAVISSFPWTTTSSSTGAILSASTEALSSSTQFVTSSTGAVAFSSAGASSAKAIIS